MSRNIGILPQVYLTPLLHRTSHMVHCWWQYTGEPWLCVSRIFLQCHISRYLYCLLWGQQIWSANPSPKIKELHGTNDDKVNDTWLRNHEFSSMIRVIIYSFLLLSLLVPNVTRSWPEDQIWFADKHPPTHFESCTVLNVFSCQHVKNQDLSHTKKINFLLSLKIQQFWKH